jgi:glycosyltransferase involved in cell wall biosynthesis
VEKVKILHVCSTDQAGGAARAAFRLNEALNQWSDVDSWMLVQRKTSHHPRVIGPESQFLKALYMAKPRIDSIGVKSISHFSLSRTPSMGIVRKINELNPDVVHLHWVNEGMLSLKDLRRLARPIVWSLHDMWPMTGGCHYTGTCENYKKECHSCPILSSEKYKDQSYNVFHKKKRIYGELSLTPVGLSKWMREEAASSSLLKGFRNTNLPNLIDTSIYLPISKEESKRALGVDVSTKLLLFGAVNPTAEKRKGFSELMEAVKGLDRTQITLGILGNVAELPSELEGFPVCKLGLLSDDLALKVAYNAADLLIVPSLQENLSNMILESMACGTPVVAFDIGGNGDMIDHCINGFLARPYLSVDLANGITWVLNQQVSSKLREVVRQKIVHNFAYGVVAPEYAKLYKDIIVNARHN